MILSRSDNQADMVLQHWATLKGSCIVIDNLTALQARNTERG